MSTNNIMLIVGIMIVSGILSGMTSACLGKTGTGAILMAISNNIDRNSTINPMR